MKELTPTERRALRAQAHHLDPVVMVGDAGLTPGVLHEIDLALKSHELIKVRILGDDRDRRGTFEDEICSALDASPVQQIGKILVLYRQRPAESGAPGKPAPRRSRRGKRRTKRSYQNR